MERTDEKLIVFESESKRKCFEMQMVLEASGIPSLVSHRWRGWSVAVDRALAASAAAEIADYQSESEAERSESHSIQTRAATTPPGAILGVCCYVLVLFIFAAIDWSSSQLEPGEQFPFFARHGQLDVLQVLDGQWWRAITALTLHSDGIHLSSNLLYGSIFGFLAGRLLGGGVGWLTILAGGFAGNMVNAWTRGSEHFAIGASTAVFAALGIAVAHGLAPLFGMRGKTFGRSMMRRWTPLISGLVLLGWFGMGDERTDVNAHISGFFCGLGAGWLTTQFVGNWLVRERNQWIAAALALILVVGAWGLALFFG